MVSVCFVFSELVLSASSPPFPQLFAHETALPGQQRHGTASPAARGSDVVRDSVGTGRRGTGERQRRAGVRTHTGERSDVHLDGQRRAAGRGLRGSWARLPEASEAACRPSCGCRHSSTARTLGGCRGETAGDGQDGPLPVGPRARHQQPLSSAMRPPSFSTASVKRPPRFRRRSTFQPRGRPAGWSLAQDRGPASSTAAPFRSWVRPASFLLK